MKYTDLNKFTKALHKGKIAGVVLWQGASAINGEPIVLVATKFDSGSDNEKTGAMVQTFILPDPIAAGVEVNGSKPAKIVAWLERTGAQSICGDCPHAWQFDASLDRHAKGTCYVREYQAPAAVLGAVARGSYPIAGIDFPAAWIPYLAKGLMVRLGSYGDPAACDPAVVSEFVALAKGRTGYTHMWKSAFHAARDNAEKLAPVVMASCDGAADLTKAKALGYRAFTVVPQNAAYTERAILSVGAHVSGSMICPASEEFEIVTGKLSECAKCGACSGTGGKGEKMPDVFIPAHGATAGRIKECPAVSAMVASFAVA
jgi:hypothetical protein